MGMPCIIIELRGIALQVLENARVRAMQVLWEGYGVAGRGYAIPWKLHSICLDVVDCKVHRADTRHGLGDA